MVLTVTINHEDIADITHHMNEGFKKAKLPIPSQGYLEYLMCDAIKDGKDVDFYAEERKNTAELEKESIKIEKEIQKSMAQEADEGWQQ